MTYLKQDRNGNYEYFSGETGEVVQIELDYCLASKPRGIYLRISTVTVGHDNGFRTVSFMLFSDNAVRALICQLPRKNSRILTQYAFRLDQMIPELLAAYQESKDNARQLIQSRIAA